MGDKEIGGRGDAGFPGILIILEWSENKRLRLRLRLIFRNSQP
jgi:hypothetical protein